MLAWVQMGFLTSSTSTAIWWCHQMPHFVRTGSFLLAVYSGTGSTAFFRISSCWDGSCYRCALIWLASCTMRGYSRRSGELKNSFTEKWINCVTFSIRPQIMHFFRFFREGGLGLRSPRPSERTSLVLSHSPFMRPTLCLSMRSNRPR